ncbi:MAG: hypothetical protein LBV62_00600 [Rickettsiales bacterium]|jgi:hypothetical protein|nr:hypothetical protein [Rickettsiales bacterium]
MATAKVSDFYNVESEVTSLNSNSSPDNFYIGQAIGNGSCFFDSFRQGLEQQKGIEVTVEQLREDCKEFAQNNPPEWFILSIANSHDNNGQRRNETVDTYTANIMDNNKWGDPEVEGRILCEKYDVKLHVAESNPLYTVNNQQDQFLHQLIDNSGSKSAGEYNKVDYDDNSVLHVINKGKSHFEPLLDRNKSLAKQEQEDFLLAKKLQVEEILKYCNISKDSSIGKEVEKTLDGLLAKNTNKEIGDVIEQCVSDVAQRIKRSEEQNPSNPPRCGMEETRTEKTFHQQPQLVKF